MILTKIEPRSAGRNPSTRKPSTNFATSKNNDALMTKIKIPRVSMVIGSVSKIRNGRTSAFKIPKMNAATTAVMNPSTCIPGIIYATSSSVPAVKNSRIKNFICT